MGANLALNSRSGPSSRSLGQRLFGVEETNLTAGPRGLPGPHQNVDVDIHSMKFDFGVIVFIPDWAGCWEESATKVSALAGLTQGHRSHEVWRSVAHCG